MAPTISRPTAGLERVREDWRRLGQQDPMWAVLVTPQGRHGGWRPEDFYATGQVEVDRALAAAARLGIHPGLDVALDFGCGVGRLSVALAAHVNAVIGVDISAPMIEQARHSDNTGRCTFILNLGDDLSMIDDDSVDIVYSSLVLQHIPPPHNANYLLELLRVLRPGGVLIAQLATRPDRSLRGRVSRVAPRVVMRFAQRVLLRYPAPMEMHAMSPDLVAGLAARHAAEVVAADEEPMYGGHWIYTRYYITKRDVTKPDHEDAHDQADPAASGS